MEYANYNLSLHRKVLRLLGMKMDIEEMLDDYQKIYEEVYYNSFFGKSVIVVMLKY